MNNPGVSPAVPTSAAVPAPPAHPPFPDFAQWGPVELVRLSAIQRKTAEHLSLAWRLAPHVTQFDFADITELESLRRRHNESEARGARITVTAFVFRALATLLLENPPFNATLDLDNNRLIVKRYVHIGVAVDTPQGLIVPVIRDANRKNVVQIAAEIAEIADRTRRRKITPDDLCGGTFTVTNLGGIGGAGFTPILNYPEVAILGLARTRIELALREGRVEERLMLPLCLSYDHRVVNGADAARFARALAVSLEKPEALLASGDDGEGNGT